MDTIVRVAENAAAVFRYQMEHSSFRTAEAEKKGVSNCQMLCRTHNRAKGNQTDRGTLWLSAYGCFEE